MAASEDNPKTTHPLSFLGFKGGASSNQDAAPSTNSTMMMSPITEGRAKRPTAPKSRPQFEFEMRGDAGGPSPPPSPSRPIRKPSPHSSPSMSAIRGLEHEVPPLSITGDKPPRKAHQGRFFVEVTSVELVVRTRWPS